MTPAARVPWGAGGDISQLLLDQLGINGSAGMQALLTPGARPPAALACSLQRLSVRQRSC